jgi:uncharacterized repeat protein (TIGR01451 family)
MAKSYRWNLVTSMEPVTGSINLQIGDCQSMETFAALRAAQSDETFFRSLIKMNFKLRIFAVLLGVFIVAVAGSQAQAQTYFGLGVTSSADSILVSNSLTYTISVTNYVGDLLDVAVTNTLPASVQLLNATPSVGGTATTNDNVVVFHTGGLAVYDTVQMTLTVLPTATGLITNMVFVSAPLNPVVTNTAATNVVTAVTNAIPPMADLSVTITLPTTAVITNDLVPYGVYVTNLGPNAATSVMLTNTLPPGVILKGSYTVISNNVIFNLGTLTNGGFTNLMFTVQPTNPGVLNFFAAVGSSSVFDTNLSNNTASNSLTVIGYLPGTLVAVTNSAQIVNPQNGLIEQSVLISNVGTNDAPAVRLIVTGLPNRLANAIATNSGNPYVVCAAPLTAGANVTLLLQYAPRTNFPFANSQLQAFAVPLPDLSPPAAVMGTNIAYTRIVMLTNGLPLIEFPSTQGRSYTIVYSDNMLFSNAMIAPPSIVAPGNQVHWTDYGPPTTVSSPLSSGSRYYRIYLNP